MKILKVSLWGRLRNGFDPDLTGKRFLIDRLKGDHGALNCILARVRKLYREPQWLDIGWFDFEEK